MCGTLVELVHVGKSFPGQGSPVAALQDVTLALPHGGYLSITGPSGSGKSTLLNIIGMLDDVSEGTYRYNSADTALLTDAARSALRGSAIGFVFQESAMIAHLTVLENVVLPLKYADRTRRRLREALGFQRLAEVGLMHRSQALPGELSGGERQRVAIARALIASPSLLLCDEPTGSLDSGNGATVLDLLEAQHNRGVALVVVTHDREIAERASTEVHIRDGRATTSRSVVPA